MSSKLKDSVVLITGGAGLIGSYVAEKLLGFSPEKIIIIDNLTRGREENITVLLEQRNVQFYKEDIRNYPLLNDLMRECDYCLHFAAPRINQCAEDPRSAYEVMVEATFNMIEAAKNYGTKKIVFASTASVYGMAQNFPTPETEPPYGNKTIYGAFKLAGEQMLRAYHDMYDLNYVALRFFNVYGPRMDAFGKYTEVMIKWMECLRQQQQPQIFGDGTSTADYIFVEDVANAVVASLTENISDDIINIGSGKETSLIELLEILLEVNGLDLHPQFLPVNKINSVTRRCADISKAKKLLSFQPKTSLKEGIRQLSDWYFAANT